MNIRNIRISTAARRGISACAVTMATAMMQAAILWQAAPKVMLLRMFIAGPPHALRTVARSVSRKLGLWLPGAKRGNPHSLEGRGKVSVGTEG